MYPAQERFAGANESYPHFPSAHAALTVVRAVGVDYVALQTDFARNADAVCGYLLGHGWNSNPKN